MRGSSGLNTTKMPVGSGTRDCWIAQETSRCVHTKESRGQTPAKRRLLSTKTFALELSIGRSERQIREQFCVADRAQGPNVKLRGTMCGLVVALTVGAWGQAPSAPSTFVAPRVPTSLIYAPQRPQGAMVQRKLPDAPSSSAALTDSQKFQVFMSSASSPLTFAGAGLNSAAGRARVPYGQSWSWTRSYTAALAQRESNEFFGRFLFPKLLGHDPRYHPAESEKFMGRASYAASRVLITRKDDGTQTLNTSYLLGTLLSSTVANVYRPRWERGVGNTFSDVGTTIGSDAGFNILREFWPQLRQTLSNHTPKQLKRLSEKFAGDEEASKDKEDKNVAAR